MVVLLPSFGIFSTVMIKFACSLQLEFNGVENLCRFIATVLFDQYSWALQYCAYQKSRCNNIGILLHGVENLCRFVANVLFNQYSWALQLCAYQKSGCNDIGILLQQECSLVSDWIGALASNLHLMACHQIFDQEDKRDEKAAEASTEKVLNDLITPLLKAVHMHVTKASKAAK